MNKWVTVKDMLEYCQEETKKLLSDFGSDGDFWTDYRTNSSDYDKLFSRYFTSFRYFAQEVGNEETLAEITERFIFDVKMHLTMNKKMYEELYRIEVLQDEDYGLFDNVDYTEEQTGHDNIEGQYISGSRTDNVNENVGNRVDITEHEVSAYNSGDYQPQSQDTTTIGAQQNGTQTTVGQETDTNSQDRWNTNTTKITGKNSWSSKGELINDHIRTWNNYEFYYKIFLNISRDLLLN